MAIGTFFFLVQEFNNWVWWSVSTLHPIYTLLLIISQLEAQSEKRDFVTVGFSDLAPTVVTRVKELRFNY